MNPSSLDIDLPAVQRQRDMNRNRPGDELGETNKWDLNPDSKYDEGSPNLL